MKSIITEIPSREAFFKGKGTLEIGYPWLTFGAIIALESLIDKDKKVLEFGSGGSTVFWAERCQSVKSFESDNSWYEKVSKRISEFSNIEIILADQSETLNAIEKEPDNYYDFVLVDSYPKTVNRLLIANAVVQKIKTTGWIIIDNYTNFGMNNFDYSPFDVYSFDEMKFSGRGTRICQKRYD